MDPKLHYFLNSTKKLLLGKGLACPSCGASDSTLICRKYFVTSLRRCADCLLQFRVPTSSEIESAAFYHTDYKSGFTTEMPTPSELDRCVANRFAGTPKDFGRYAELLVDLGCNDGNRLLDFGCSWGYGAYQFMQRGLSVTGFDVSLPRVRYAREMLGVRATTELSEIEGPFDIVFSAHVLEHVPSLKDVITFLFRLLKVGGLFVSITPNGSIQRRRKNEDAWMRAWGLKHPNLLDELFFQQHLIDRPLLLTSALTEHRALTFWAQNPGRQMGPLKGDELLAACKNQRL